MEHNQQQWGIWIPLDSRRHEGVRAREDQEPTDQRSCRTKHHSIVGGNACGMYFLDFQRKMDPTIRYYFIFILLQWFHYRIQFSGSRWNRGQLNNYCRQQKKNQWQWRCKNYKSRNTLRRKLLLDCLIVLIFNII